MKVHIMGIGGMAMANFAVLLKTMGHEVTGSDGPLYEPSKSLLQNHNILVFQGYEKENLEQKPDYVVVGNVISSHFEEAKELLRLQIPYCSFPQALLQWVIEKRQSFVVCGTHGKTTTTALLSWAACENGLDPGFFIGGMALNFPQSLKKPEKDTFIIEGDEYDTAFFDKRPKFLHYKPQSVILTSLEFDHGDIYKDLEDVKKSFAMLLQAMPEKGHLIYHAGDYNIKALLDTGLGDHLNVKSYGMENADYILSQRKIEGVKQSFSVLFEGKPLAEDVEIKLMGLHNALNCLSVIAFSHQLSWSLEKTTKSFLTFKGVKRRQEILEQKEDLILMEDFAHHPTSVGYMISTIKEHFGSSHKLVAVFEPRSNTSQRSFFQKDYAEAFKGVDCVFFPKKLNSEGKIDKKKLLCVSRLKDDLREQNVETFLFEHNQDILKHLRTFLEQQKKPTLVLVMSNGGFGGLFSFLKKELF